MTRETEDLGLGWIGKIPIDYGVWSIGNFFHQLKNKNDDLLVENLLSLSYGEIIRRDIHSPEGLLPSSFSGYNIVEKDDIVLRMTDLQNDKKSLRTGIVTEKGIITSAYITLRKKTNLPLSIYSKYIYYQLHAFDIVKGFYGMGNGVRQNVNFNDIKKMKIILPEYQKQKRIVTILEHELERIENITRETEQSIEELKEYKQSIITETVTKGLDLDVEMKDSGVDWIGRTPLHWKYTKISRVTHSYSGGTPSRQMNSYWDNGDIPWVASGEVNKGNIYDTNEKITTKGLKNSSAKLFPSKTILVALNGQGRTKAMSAILEIEATTNQSLVGFICNQEELNYLYLNYIFIASYQFNRSYYAGGDKRDGIAAGDLRQAIIPLPPLSEQNEIINILDSSVYQTKLLIKDKERVIKELEQYKKSLIYEYVTGKKEV